MRFLDAAGVAKREKRNNPEKAVPRKERKAQAEGSRQGRGRTAPKPAPASAPAAKAVTRM